MAAGVARHHVVNAVENAIDRVEAPEAAAGRWKVRIGEY